MMRTLLAVLAVLAASFLTAQDVTYTVGLAPNLSPDHAKAAYGAIWEIVRKADPGHRIEIWDAHGLAHLASVTVADGPPRLRERMASGELAKVRAFLKKPEIQHASSEAKIRLPQFLIRCVGANLRSGGGETRVLVFGSPFYNDAERDQEFCFAKDGEVVPRLGNLLVSQSQSIYGCADLRDTLTGCTLHLCTFEDPYASTLQATAVQEFWSAFASELGCALVSEEISPTKAIEKVLAGVKQPLLKVELDRDDRRLGMRPFKGEKPPEVDSKESKDDANPDSRIAVLPGTDVGVLVDVSGSNHDNAVKIETDVMARLWSYAPDLRLGVVSHGGSRYATHALAAKALAPAQKHEGGSECNPEFALTRGIALFDDASASRSRVLVFVGDKSTDEAYSGLDAIRSEARAVGAAQAFAAAGGRLIVVYSGEKGAEEQRFYEELAKAAGKNGTFLDATNGVDVQAILTALVARKQ
jgi:hypothetical protein